MKCVYPSAFFLLKISHSQTKIDIDHRFFLILYSIPFKTTDNDIFFTEIIFNRNLTRRGVMYGLKNALLTHFVNIYELFSLIAAEYLMMSLLKYVICLL